MAIKWIKCQLFYLQVPKNVKFGHPKFYKLQEILLHHFKEKGDYSKVIVFFEYWDSVMEAFALLGQYQPILKPRICLGQTNGITQKCQINVSIPNKLILRVVALDFLVLIVIFSNDS